MVMDLSHDGDSGSSRAGEDEEYGEDEQTWRNKEEEEKKSTRRSNQRRHTHNSRAKLNMKFEELNNFIAPNMPQSSTSSSAKTHKSKIISDAIQMYNSLMKKKETLGAEITFSSQEKLEEWIEQVVEKNASNLNSILAEVVRLLAIKQEWAYAEVWVPEEVNGAVHLVLVHHLINPTSDNDTQEQMRRFHSQSSYIQYRPPEGAQGRAYQTTRIEWLSDLTDATVFPAADAAAETGLQTACSIPLKKDLDSYIAAVLMFYSCEWLQFDAGKITLIEDVLKSILVRLKGQQRSPVEEEPFPQPTDKG
eukprot:Plantae.Rhodophyta-Purpureofilum_apyrenoidigerum.ctg13599.p1 GENE.Plantae.Rhodophyta-Purpureofilum_apyrenoidigerum.ctg13599~~Plantae.Rhodophyta-Purpureofilum_apyrenoidigerum.ctg13599.p1  ORF type:complete len:306 (+),score=62.26 Plantae.Rhodophyta-Purpureofilum_apyrenoidigerum.ctg13599:235-1152(+)